MAQKKAFEVDRWLVRPDPAVRIVLVYGPDRGLVSERARTLVKSTGLPPEDPFSVIRLEASELDQSPGRLENEARTVPMFAGKRLLWISNAGTQKALADDIGALAADPVADTLVLIEAGDLKKGAALRTTIEASPHGMALPCYADDAKSIDVLIDEEIGRFGLTITLDAREMVKANLGGDRLASRGEVAKLSLYCQDAGSIGIEDVRAILGDAASVSVDEVVDAVLAGKLRQFDLAFERHTASGAAPFLVLAAAMRQFQALQQMRDAMERDGKTAAAVVASARPPVFFSRRTTIENALKRWNAALIVRTLARLQDAVLQSRRFPSLSQETCRHALLGIAVAAANN